MVVPINKTNSAIRFFTCACAFFSSVLASKYTRDGGVKLYILQMSRCSAASHAAPNRCKVKVVSRCPPPPIPLSEWIEQTIRLLSQRQEAGGEAPRG